VIPTGEGILVMRAKSVKRVLGLAVAAVSTSGTMMFAPAVANAATAHPAHAQAVSNVSKTIDGNRAQHPNYRHPHGYRHGYRGGYGGYGGGYGGYRGGYRHGYRGGYGGGYGGYRGGYGGYRGGYGGYRGGYRYR
jgi:hypothetical protein